jgi:hypothetical protein
MASSPNLQLVIRANVTGQQQVQALSQALSQLQVTARSVGSSGSNPFASFSSGAASAAVSADQLGSSIVASAAKMAAGFFAAKAAAEGFFAAFKKGLAVNASMESMTLGIETLIAASYQVKDANGQLVEGPQKYAMAAEEASKQMLLLKKAGLETSATTEQLGRAFQAAIGAGATAGLKIDDIRKLTISTVQAAATLQVPMTQLNQEITSILKGQVDRNSVVGQALQLDNTQLKLWAKKGVLADELNKKFKVYNDLAGEAGQTWTSTLSNVGEAIENTLGQMAKPAFDGLKKAINDSLKEVMDPETLGVSKSFSEIEKLGETIFGGLGHLLSDGIYAAVDGAKAFNAWLAKNSDTVTSLELTFGYIVDAVLAIAKTIGSATVSIVQWGIETGVFQTALNSVALTLAMIQDGFQLMKQYIAEAGAWVLDKFAKPIEQTLQLLAAAVQKLPVIGAGISDGIMALTQQIPKNGNGLRAVAQEVANNFAAGRTAVDAMQKRLETGLKTAKENAAEMERLKSKQKDTSSAGSTLTPNPKAPDKKDAAKVQKALEDIAKAQADAVKRVNDAARAADQADLDAKLQDQLISYQDYVAKKAALQRDALAEEKAALEKERAQTMARQTEDQASALKKKADLIKIQGQIDAVVEKQRQVAIKIKVDTTQAERDIRDFQAQVQSDLLASQGDAAGAERVRLQNELQKALENPKTTGDDKAVKSIRQTNANKVLQNDISEEETLLQRRNDEYSRYNEALQQQQDAGLITSLQHETLLQAKRAEIIAQEEKLVSELEANAARSDDPSLKAKAEQARLELNALKLTANSVAKEVNTNLSQALVQGFDDAITRAKTFSDVLRDVLLSIVNTWKKIAEQNLSEAIFGKLGGSQSGLGGMFSASSGGLDFGNVLKGMSSFFGGFFADGGIIRGPGTGTSDSILTRLSDGEGIVKAKAVQYWGEDFIHFLNNSPAYATGGISGGSTSDKVTSALAATSKLGPAVSAQTGGASPVNLRIVNAVDPSMMRNSLDSTEGERIIENVLSRNPSRFKSALNIR